MPIRLSDHSYNIFSLCVDRIVISSPSSTVSFSFSILSMKSESIALLTIGIAGKVKKKLSPLPKGLVIEKMLTRSENKNSYVEEKKKGLSY